MKIIKHILYTLAFISIALIAIYLYTKGVLTTLISDKLTIRDEFYLHIKKEAGFTFYIIVIVLFVPILEEALYRLGLKFSINGVAALCLGISYSVYLFFQPSDINWKNPYVLITFWSAFIFTFFLYQFLLKKHQSFVINFYKRNTNLIILVSIISFAYSHITLYGQQDLINNLFLSPLILLPYVIAGALFSFLRIKFGFWYGVLGHIFWNSLVFYLSNY